MVLRAPAQIHRKVSVPHFIGNILKETLPRNAGVVHHQLHRTERFPQFLDHARHGGTVGNIRLKDGGLTTGSGELLHQLLCLILPVQIVDAYGPALMGQFPGPRRGPMPREDPVTSAVFIVNLSLLCSADAPLQRFRSFFD